MSRIPLKELQELENAGIITRETSVQIHNYYLGKRESAPNTFIIILGILGAVLTGGGVLLIVAHNWDELSIPVKTILAFVPLLLSQAAAVYTMLKRNTNRVWIECCTVFLFFAIGSCMALISQVYQVNGSLPSFLLTWVLLSFPIIYFLPANAVALFCIAAITMYAVTQGYYERYGGIPFMYVLVAGCMIPHYYKTYRKAGESNFFVLLTWFAVISLTVSLGAFAGRGSSHAEWVFLLYCILFCIYYQTGRLPFYRVKTLRSNPFLVIGTAGIIITLLIWSFTFILNEYKVPQAVELYGSPLFYLVAAGIFVVVILTWKNSHTDQLVLRDPMTYSFAVLLVLLLFFYRYPSIASFIVNAWVIFIAVFFIRRGAAKNHLGIVNFGLFILASLAICRFFDDRIPFIWRGIFFLATGASFFMGNYLLIRKRKNLLKPDTHD